MCEVSFDHLAPGARLRELTASGVHDSELATMERIGAELGVDRELELAPAPDQELLRPSECGSGAARAAGASRGLEGSACLVDAPGGLGEARGRVTSIAGGTCQLATP